MGKNIVYGFLAILCLVVLDIFARFLYAQSWFSKTVLTNEINPLEILSLVLSTAIAIWVGWFITKKLSAQRYQKEYIISDLKQIEEEVTCIERTMLASNIELQTLLDLLNKFKIYIDRFTKTIDVFQISSIDASRLNEHYNTLYRKTTDTDGSQLEIDESTRIEIKNVCTSFILEARRMIFVVNRK